MKIPAGRDSMNAEEIYSEILEQISRGVWTVGQQLPTERAFAERYGVSRPTISRVLNRLKAAGHITRAVGAGTFLTEVPAPAARAQRKSIGLFIPGLGRGEIFEPICAHIAELSNRHDIMLIWGSLPAGASRNPEQLVQAAERLVAQGVNGVFFQPVEREKGAEQQNRRITELFTGAGVKLVLLDSDFLPFPDRGPYDLVAIDNIGAGYELCRHFLVQGAQRVDFLWRPYTAGTYEQRLIGYREALVRAGIAPNPAWEHEGDASELSFVARIIDGGARNIICVNDETASQVMRGLDDLGLSVPNDVRIAGFDDVKYAHLLRVPLTTMRQPCRALAEIAVRTMINRIDQPELPPAILSVRAELCVRRSSRLGADAQATSVRAISVAGE